MNKEAGVRNQNLEIRNQKKEPGLSLNPGTWRLAPVLLLSAFCLLSSAFAQTPTTTALPLRTYRAAYSVACGGAGDCATIYYSSKIIRVRQVVVQPSTAITVSLIVRSAADSGGTTSTVPTAVSMDTNDIAATATLATYTGAPTAGSTVGSVALLPLAANSTWVQSFGMVNSKSLVLQSAGQGLAVNVSGAATIYVNLEWTENP
jgi:hypothetical protein